LRARANSTDSADRESCPRAARHHPHFDHREAARMIRKRGLIAQGHAFVMALRPLDWSHWLLLLGAVTLTWRLTDIPVGLLGRLGRLATIAGATAFIGMSVIDFTLWALPSEMARQTFGSLILHVPAISLPFLSVGPSLLFVGLGVMVLEWVVVMRWRVW